MNKRNVPCSTRAFAFALRTKRSSRPSGGGGARSGTMAGKRPYSHYDPGDPSGKPHNKRHQASSSYRRSNSSISPGSGSSRSMEDAVFRILCPAAKTGGVIGKGGSIIKSLRLETGAKIKIEEPIHGSEERVIIISAADDGLDSDDGVPAAVPPVDIDDYTQGKEVNVPAQLALLKVHSRILDADKYDDELDELDDYEDEEPNAKVTTRLLVPESQVGCLLGKKGVIIEKMREETGTQIRILPREHLPSFALPTDEVVQVVGEKICVKRALFAISTRLLDNPPKDRLANQQFHSYNYQSRGYNNNSNHDNFVGLGGPSPRFTGIHHRNDVAEAHVYQLLRPTAPGLSEFGGGRHVVPVDEELVFRVLCPLDKIGSIIGKGGGVIQQLRDETGAKIKVAEPIPGSDERVIIVSALECPDEDLSPAQEAVFHIQERMREGIPDSESVTTRLLVPSNQVGCLLGKGGHIIMEMRKQTRANIRVFSKDQLPACALENDEVVQVVGEIRVARDALVRITSRLRANLYREKTDNRSEGDFGAYQRATSPVCFPSAFSMQAAQPSAVQQPRSPRSWFNQNERALAALASFAGLDRNSGFGASPHPQSPPALPNPLVSLGASVVALSKVEVLVPDGAVAALNVGNVAQIMKLSGAKINVVDGFGAPGKVVEISGTPEQISAAKSLVEAFCATNVQL